MNLEKIFDSLSITSLGLFLFFFIILVIVLIKNKNKHTKKLDNKLSKITGDFFLLFAILYTAQVCLAIYLNMPRKIIVLDIVCFVVSLYTGVSFLFHDEMNNA